MVKLILGLIFRFDLRVFKIFGLCILVVGEWIYNILGNGSFFVDSKEIFFIVLVGGGESL